MSRALKFAGRKTRRAVAGIVATIIMFSILFTVGTAWFVFLGSQNSSYASHLLSATNNLQGSLQESVSVATVLQPNGDVGFEVNNTSSLTVNMTAALVISSTGTLLTCVGVGFPAGAGCHNSTPALWMTVDAGSGSPAIDTGYLYVAGTTDSVKVITARGNSYSQTYPEPASQSSSSQSVTVNLDNLKWVQLLPQASSLVQKKYVSNCNAASCAAAFTSSVTAGNILVDAVGWGNQAPPSGVPTDTRGNSFTLGSSNSVGVPSSPGLTQNKYTSNCNAASCGLAFSSSVTSGNTLVYAVGWANQSPPSAPTDTRGDSFTLGSSNSVTVSFTPALVQEGYASNCNATACALGYSSNVAAGDTLVLGLGWPSTQVYNYVPITITNSQGSATPNPFQQMVTWNPSTYSSYEAANLGNIRFCADIACASPFNSWLESCSSTCSTSGSSSTSATAWVKLTSSIAAGGALTIYMVFQSTSTNFDGVYWGEAPQQSGTYAQYDNGANVFTFYDNFVGTTLSNLWTNNVSNAGGTLTINNGMSYTRPGGGNNYPFIYSTSTFSQGVYETYGNIPAGGGSGSFTYAGFGLASSANFNAGAGVGDWNSVYGLYTGTSPSGAADTIVSGLSGGTYIWSLFVPSSSPTSYSGSQNYGSTISSSTNLPTLPYPIVFSDQVSTGKNVGTFNWVRDRAYPPSGVMPSVSVGSFTSGSLSYVPITITNNQGSATPNPFQQMVTWNPSTYSSYEATNLGNIRFCADSGCNSPLYSWLESCSSTCSSAGSSSTSATAWVRLTSAIAGSGGTLTIYMVFGPTTTNFDGAYWGEAPQLSSIYAQYDNGASVFTAYFNGNTPTSSFSVYAGYTLAQSTGTSGPGGTTINALKITGNTATNAAFPAFSFNSAMSNVGLITESSFSAPGCTVGGGYTGTDSGTVGLLNNAAVGSVNNGVSANCGYAGDYFDQDYDTAGTMTAYANSQGTATSSWIYGTLTYPGSGSSSWSAYIAPQLYSTTGGYSGTVNSNPLSGATHLYLGQISYSSNGYAVTTYYNFDRARAYPPSNVMPSTSLGSVTSGTGSPISVTDTLGDSFSLGVSQSATSGSSTYESGIWYATASGTGADTITATFGSVVAGSVSIYDLSGYTTAGAKSSTGSSTGGSTSASVASFTPTSNSFAVGNVETGSSATRYTVGSGYTTVLSGAGGCDGTHAAQGCSEYESGLGSATTAPFTLSASTPWAEAAMSFAPAPSVTYYSYLWYAKAASTGADTISASFGATVAGSVSIYEISGVSSSGILSSTGGSTTSQSSTSVTSMSPTSGSVVVGNTEASSTTFTAGSGYTLSGTCNSVGGCGEYQTGVGSSTTVPMSISPSGQWVEVAVAFAPTVTTYYSYIWYATAASSGADTITATFGSTVAGSVSIYEITGFTTSGVLSSTGSLSTGSTGASVASFTPTSDSFTVGSAEGASGSTTFTATSGFSLVGTCNSVGGCSEYNSGGGGSANTVPITLGASTPWVESALSFSTPFNLQSGIQVGGYPTMGVPSGASLVWEVTFTNVDAQHRVITIWPQSELAVGLTGFDGSDIDYIQEHYYIIDSLNPGSTTVNGYTSTTGGTFLTLNYGVPTTLYFAATQALGSATQAFGTEVLTPFEAYFALTGVFSDGTLYGETIPYPYGIVTQSNAYTTPTVGGNAATVTVSCTSPCHFSSSSTAFVGWINAAGDMIQLTTFTTTAGGNIPAGVTFAVPTAAAGYYTIEVTDYTNTIFMTFQHT